MLEGSPAPPASARFLLVGGAEGGGGVGALALEGEQHERQEVGQGEEEALGLVTEEAEVSSEHAHKE